jgi:hypothetical protein
LKKHSLRQILGQGQADDHRFLAVSHSTVPVGLLVDDADVRVAADYNSSNKDFGLLDS